MATPALVAAPGMPSSEVLKLSEMALKPPRPNIHHGYIQPKEPHRVVLKDDLHGFEIPPGLFSLVETRYDKVQRLRATPHIDYVGVDDAVAVLQVLSDSLAAAGWKGPVFDPAPVAEQIRKSGFAVLERWRAGPWVAELNVRRSVLANSTEGREMQLEEDGHLVTLQIWDEDLLAEDEWW
jgi:hypothetical protein